MNINTVEFMTVVAVIATIVFTILAYMHIVPEKKRAELNKLGQFLHDVFNFKFLIIEKVLQFLYILCTIACVCFGASMLLGISIYHSEWLDKTYTEWYGIYGILIAVIGPFLVRLAYEGVMMALILVKNVIQINQKLKSQVAEEEYEMPKLKDLIKKENFTFGMKKPADPAETNEE